VFQCSAAVSAGLETVPIVHAPLGYAPARSRPTSVILPAVTVPPSLDGMAFRCVLFSSDPGTIEPVCQAFADLGVEGEHCSEAVAAVDKVCRESFQILIVDWDKPTEAGALLTAARNRKITERPLTVAVVSQDAAVSKALQAGATSTLRKPVQLKQITDSLSRARDLLRARESAAQAAAAGVSSTAASTAPSNISTPNPPPNDAGLRAGDFLQTSSPASQFDTESEMQKSIEQSATQEINALKDLEPTASAVAHETPSETVAPKPSPDGPRGLQWYLDQRAGKSAAATAPAHVPGSSEATPGKSELLGFDQSPSFLGAVPGKTADAANDSAAPPAEQEKKAEAELFSYIAGEEKEEKNENKSSRVRIGKGPIIVASALAACAIAAAPQAPWHPQMQKLWAHGRQSMHAWLNPQVSAPAQAPISHESFGRAGDEYKLPVAENIPDATTDPTQIKVTPMVDPTAKKQNNGANDPNLAPADANPSDTVQNLTPTSNNPNSIGATPNNSAPGNSAPSNSTSTNPQPTSGGDNSTSANPSATNVAPGNAQLAGNPAISAPATTSSPSSESSAPSASAPTQPAPAKSPQPRPAATTYTGPPIPSSLKSQMASMTPEASGNKAPETALPSIEPVAVPEATERGLIIDQPAPGYPDSAKGQQGTVVLQVLIGRDGSVQDAKFLQGSLAFARAAIDGVRPWRFKPYVMNGRPVSVQTNLTISFVPGH
jgi:protein TonB